jgi:hypothetical protein
MTIGKIGDSVDTANNWTETGSRHLNYRDRLFVSVNRDLDHFNKENHDGGWRTQNVYQYKLESQVKNQLVFIHSELSPHYYSSARFRAAFFQREREPYGQEFNSNFQGTGRFTLFNIINPSPKLRFIIDFSRTALGDGREKLPSKARLIGEDDYPLPFVGYGSSRIVSGPITPEYFEQQAYITVDFAETPQPILKEKTGLMRLYGLKFNLDDRRLVGFTRDMSVISEDDYLSRPRPTKLSSFPHDLYLTDKLLEYSGLYEDGWICRDAFVKLAGSHPGQVLYFKGFIPDTEKFRTQGVDVTISINQKPTEIVNLRAGEFTLTRLIREAADVTSISLHFSDAEPYGEKDKRPMSAFVHEISISDIPDLTAFRKLTNQKGDKFDLVGVDDDGWIGKSVKFTAPAFADFKVLKIDLETPGWSPLATNKLTATVNGAPFYAETAKPATYPSIHVPMIAGQRTEVQLDSAAVFPLPGDKRERSFIIKNISFENLGLSDLFTRGWHKSGYLFDIDRADADGWVDRHIAFRFPATAKFKTAIVEIMRYPAKADLPIGVTVNGAPAPDRLLELQKTERILVPLSATGDTSLTLGTERNFSLAAPDTRMRSFRIVNIDFQ